VTADYARALADVDTLLRDRTRWATGTDMDVIADAVQRELGGDDD
jgi:hypothetical protein